MAYGKGDKVRVQFTGVVKSTGNVNSTCEVTEKGGDGAGYTHYVYLGSDTARSQVLAGDSPYNGFADPSIGDTIEIDFEAVIGSLRNGPSSTSTVSSGVLRARYSHCIYLGSPSITPVLSSEEKAAEEKAAAAVLKAAQVLSGQPVRARFTATVTDERGPYNTTRVEEDNGVSHYLYLRGTDSPREILGQGAAAPSAGDRITVSLDGKARTAVPGTVALSSGVFVQVQTKAGWNHALDLASPSVSVGDEEKAAGKEEEEKEVSPEPAAGEEGSAGSEERKEPVAYEQGDEFRAELTVVVRALRSGPFSCDRVEEEGNGKVHYLYLDVEDSRKTVLAGGTASDRPRVGDRLTAAFTGKVSEFGEQQEGTRSVTTPRESVFRTWNHALDLSSPSVRPVGLADLRGAVPAGYSPLFTRDSTEISSAAVVARLVELRGAASYTVTRDRTSTVVFSAATKDACRSWLTEQDYDPGKFTVTGKILSLAEDGECADLALLLDSVSTQLGSSWRLYGAGYFTQSWARDRARAVTGRYNSAELDSWPFSVIDWEKAATARRDSDYLAFRFAGADFYGKRS